MMAETKPKPWFVFTLRESLLAMVAAGALLALAVKSFERPSPFTPSGFYRSFDSRKAEAIVQSSARNLGLQVRSSHDSASESRGGDSASRDFLLSVSSSPEVSGKLLSQLHDETQRLLKKEGCTLLSVSGSGDGTKEGVSSFSFDYKKQNTQGHLFVHRIPDTQGRWQLYVVVHEFRAK